MITPEIKNKIIETLNVVETSVRKGDYGKIAKFFDGPGKIQQITYGRSQMTEFGFLPKLIKKYAQSSGLFSSEFQPYVNRIGKTPSLVNDQKFINLLKKAASDPIMRSLQDELFENEYWMPAVIFWKENGFKTPLAALVIYDTAIHSGPALNSKKGLFYRLRNRFSEPVPINGGNEKTWVQEYVRARHLWLSNNPDKALRTSSYRTKCYLELISTNNWELDKPFKMNGVTID